MDLRVHIGDKVLPNPVGVASGTFGYGSEYRDLVNIAELGALFTKAVTILPRSGNDIPRLVETPAGLLNSIGLANVGVAAFLSEKMSYLATLPCAVVANVAGSTQEEYAEVVAELEKEPRLWGYEINLSCPNVEEGGMAIGTDARQIEAVLRSLREITSKPLIAKLTPNVTDIGILARAAEASGADAVSCINTLVGMVVDIEAKRPVIPSRTGGLSGPAIRPVGVAMTYRVSQEVAIPVIGIGGIMDAEDALQYLLAGASAVQVGTANFVDPSTPQRVLEGIKDFCRSEGLGSIEDLHRWRGNW
jgi:dihydroorotate dehydrogenase (NAD+) catalytic subunit